MSTRDGQARIEAPTPWLPRADRRMAWMACAAACATLLVWYAVVVHTRAERYVGDELTHMRVIRGLARGDWQDAWSLPMPPTFHFVASRFVRLLGEEYWAARLTNLVVGVAMLVFWAAMGRTRDGDGGAHRVLRLAWLPLAWPFYALVYTEVLSLAGVVWALVWLQRRRHVLAALGLLLSCMVRQSNVIWVACLATLALVDAWPARGPRERAGDSVDAAGRGRVGRFAVLPLWPYPAVAAVVVGTLVVQGGVLVGFHAENRPAFNPAQFHMLVLAAGLTWAPLVWNQMRRAWGARFAPRLQRPAVAAAVLVAVGIIAHAFGNPHVWNLNLDFLRNWPMYAMTCYAPARYLAAACIVVILAALAVRTWDAPRRAQLGVIWLFTALYLAPHFLVDPRYYIIPFVLIDHFTGFTQAEARRQTAWYALLCAGVSLFVALQPGGYTGVW